MSDLFKVTVVEYWLFNCWVGPDGNPCPEGTPGAKFVKARRVPKGTPGAEKVTKESSKWYGRLPGHRNPVPLSPNKAAARVMLADRLKEAEMGRAGAADPFKEHRQRPLAEHLADWEKALLADGATAKHVRQTVASARRVLEGCKFVLSDDLSASRVQAFMAELRERGRPVQPLDPGKELYTKKELAALLGVKPCAVPPLVRRHRLQAEGKGKARRFPRATAEALHALRARGRSIKTSNLYLDAVKAFVGWLVQDRRLQENVLAHLAGGNVKLDRRHDRQTLSEGQLAAILRAAEGSAIAFRGLRGRDRRLIYLAAMTTGFRAEEVANLAPESFSLDAAPPVAILPARATKNRKGATQPLPPEVAEELRAYLAGRPAGERIWPGTWYEDAAEMLRLDLEPAGVEYVLQGPDGPLYADFHSLRHSDIALLDRSGATLKEAMQLARHSDPKLTMAVYGRAQLHDLGEAVGRLPSLLTGSDNPLEGEVLRATGTDSSAPVVGPGLRSACAVGATGRDSVRVGETAAGGEAEKTTGPNPLSEQGVEAGCDSVILLEGSSPTRTRTWNKPVNSRLLYH
jgi:integrase